MRFLARLAVIAATLAAAFVTPGVAMAQLANTEFTFTNTTFPVSPPDTIQAMPKSHNTWTTVEIEVDRTVAGGLNSLTTATMVTVSFQSSADNGKTWTTEQECFFAGGPEQEPARLGGGVHTTDTCGFSIVGQSFPPNTSWQLDVNVAGPSAVVASGVVSWQ